MAAAARRFRRSAGNRPLPGGGGFGGLVAMIRQMRRALEKRLICLTPLGIFARNGAVAGGRQDRVGDGGPPTCVKVCHGVACSRCSRRGAGGGVWPGRGRANFHGLLGYTTPADGAGRYSISREKYAGLN